MAELELVLIVLIIISIIFIILIIVFNELPGNHDKILFGFYFFSFFTILFVCLAGCAYIDLTNDFKVDLAKKSSSYTIYINGEQVSYHNVNVRNYSYKQVIINDDDKEIVIYDK